MYASLIVAVLLMSPSEDSYGVGLQRFEDLPSTVCAMIHAPSQRAQNLKTLTEIILEANPHLPADTLVLDFVADCTVYNKA